MTLFLALLQVIDSEHLMRELSYLLSFSFCTRETELP